MSRNCPFCNHNPITHFGRKDGVLTLKCPVCGLIFVDEIKDYMEEDVYRKVTYFEQSENRGVGYEKYEETPLTEFIWQKAITDLFNDRKMPRLLDVGCATGKFLTLCREDYDAFGIDVSDYAISFAQKKGLNAEKKDLSQIDSKFDIVTVWETMDHIVDIRKFFEQIKQVLNKGGCFIFSTPNSESKYAQSADWPGFNQSFEHVNYFTKKSLMYMLTEIFGSKPIIHELGNPYNRKYPLIFGYVRLGKATKHDEKILNLFNSNFSDLSIKELKGKEGAIISLMIRNEDTRWPDYVELYLQHNLKDYYAEVIFKNYFYNKEGYITELRDQLSDNDAAIKNLTQELSGSNRAIAEKDTAIKNLTQELSGSNRAIAEKDAAIKNLTQELSGSNRAIAEKNSILKNFAQELADANLTISKKDKSITDLKSYVEDKEVYIAQLKSYINDKELYIANLRKYVEKSIYWQASKLVGKIKGRGISYIANKIYRYFLHDSSNPHLHLAYLKEIPVLLLKTSKMESSLITRFSAITTIKNEGDTIKDWIIALENQTLAPDEVIIVDGGSTDKTLEILDGHIKNSKFNYKLIKEKSAGISRGRNIAIDLARNDIIISVDAGSVPDKDYFKNVIKAFEADSEIDMVVGIYKSQGRSFFDRLLSKYFIPDWNNFDHESLLPSARSVGYRKELWKKVGGHPEWLKTGDDTLFDLEYRKVSRKWAVTTDALVYWEFPRKLGSILNLAYRYGKGDGESGLGDNVLYFKMKLIEKFSREKNPLKFLAVMYLLFSAIKRKSLLFSLIHYYLLKGYVNGRQRRMEVNLENGRVDKNVLILTGVPVTDIGGGQRYTQLALALIKERCKVTYVNVYPSHEEKKKIFLNTDFTLLELEQFNLFDIDEYLERHNKILDRTFVLVEFPIPSFIPIIDKMREKKIPVIYDCVDDWSTTLGWIWYSDEKEKEIIKKSDILIATAHDLKKRIESMSEGREVTIIPNAVNTDIFQNTKYYERPKDLPEAKSVIMYTGSLYGKWFDWDIIRDISREFPESAVVLIGNYNKYCPHDNLKNVYFLGLKQQIELPSYLYYADVCIIPFKIDKLTDAISPLKIYEYLAMGKPVVATNMKELHNIPYTLTANTNKEFVQLLRTALKQKPDKKIISNFIKENSWKNRIDHMLELLPRS